VRFVTDITVAKIPGGIDHRVEDADRARLDRRPLPHALCRGTGQVENRHVLGEGRQHHAAAEEIGVLVYPLVNQVCRVNLNCQCQRGPDVFPFTGRKDSAEGTLSVTDALRSFSIRSMIAAKQTESSKKLLNDIVRNHTSKFINTDFIF